MRMSVTWLSVCWAHAGDQSLQPAFKKERAVERVRIPVRIHPFPVHRWHHVPKTAQQSDSTAIS